MKKTVLILVLIIMCSFGLKGQETIFVRYDSIPIYEIVHDDFKNILDSFITHVKTQDCFNDSLVFKIGILDMHGKSIEITQSINKNSFYVKDYFETFGVLNYNGFSFHIEGRSIISEHILKKTSDKQKIMLVDLNPDYVKSSNIDWLIDDFCRVTSWIYCLIDDKFVLVHNSNDYK